MKRSVTAQSLHYLSRPHSAVRTTPLDIPAAWRSDALAEGSWIETLRSADIAELHAALQHAQRTGRPTGELTRADFPLPQLSARIADWRRTVSTGRGFVLLRGFPMAQWRAEEAAVVFWCLGQHLGTPGVQNQDGELLGHVIDTGAAPASVRLYKTAADIAYHCDPADVVGLMCLQNAARGGRSRIVSSVSVYNALLARRPDLIPRLYQPHPMDTRGESGLDYSLIPPCRFDAGTLRTFYHSDYFRSAARYPRAPRPDLELLDLYEEIANDPALYLEMDLRPGDVQLVSNHTILHARTAYTDDGPRRRHLLRLWLSVDVPTARLRTLSARLSLLATIIRLRIEKKRA